MAKTNKNKSVVGTALSILMCIIMLIGLIVIIVYFTKNQPQEDEILSIDTSKEYSKVQAVLLTDKIDDSITINAEVHDEFNFSINNSYYQYLSPEDINADHVLMINKTTNEIIYEKDVDSLCYPASTTKILTSIVALEYINPDTVFTVGDELELVPYDSSLAYIQQGEQIPLKDLLYGLMLPSGNDVGYTIAVNVARRVSNNSQMPKEDAVKYFANLMNKTAKKIGMDNSNFVVPDGFHDIQHYVTTRDMMKLLIYAQNFELLNQIASTYEYIYTASDGKTFDWINSNRLLDKSTEFYYEGVTGYKTGFHDDAGHCVAITCNKNGIELYIVIMGADTMVFRNRDTINLLNMVYNPSEIKIGIQWDLKDGETLPEGVDVYGNPIVTTTPTIDANFQVSDIYGNMEITAVTGIPDFAE